MSQVSNLPRVVNNGLSPAGNDVQEVPQKGGDLHGKATDIAQALQINNGRHRDLKIPMGGLHPRPLVDRQAVQVDPNLKLRQGLGVNLKTRGALESGVGGRAKSDVNLILFKIRRDTKYKSLLNTLDQYHRIVGHVDKSQTDQRSQLNKTNIIQAEALLKHLEREIERCVSHGAGRRTDALLKLEVAVRDERVRLDTLSDALAQPQPVDVRLLYQQASLSQEQTDLLMKLNWSPEVGQSLVRLGIPINERMLGNTPSPESVIDKNSIYEGGSGAYNKVYNANSVDGKEKFVIKPVPHKDEGWVAGKIGIEQYHPRSGVRNMATQGVAEALGFPVVAKTSLIPFKLPGMFNASMCMLMERAQGQQGGVDREVLKNGEVRRQLVMLQILDEIVGQGDRHGGNYFIHVDPKGKVTVKGIDNDQCFPGKVAKQGKAAKFLNPDEMIFNVQDKKKYGFKGVGMPAVVDQEILDAVRNLKIDDLRKAVGDLSALEQYNTLARWQAVKNHLENDAELIKRDEWASDKATILLTSANSYVGRELESASYWKGLSYWRKRAPTPA